METKVETLLKKDKWKEIEEAAYETSSWVQSAVGDLAYEPIFLRHDDELKAILAHNRDEEKEHAAMVLEWIRRQDPSFDKELKDYLFTEKQIAHG